MGLGVAYDKARASPESPARNLEGTGLRSRPVSLCRDHVGTGKDAGGLVMVIVNGPIAHHALRRASLDRIAVGVIVTGPPSK